ncbi:MAG: ATP-dependent Clp protease ATP-binding subunit ClpC, partial [Clostridia bacterium]|nr:ATP-dependent Clp protease ATP-binding subunit ClpC [Clostridia bacterium]
MKYNFGGFTGKSNEAINSAISVAESLGHTFVGSEHLLLGILLSSGSVAATILEESGISYNAVEKIVTKLVDRGIPTRLSPEHLTPRAKKIVEKSMLSAKQLG